MKFLKKTYVFILFIIFVSLSLYYIHLLSSSRVESLTLDGQPDNITVVSGYWKVNNKHGHSKYDDWFKNSLKINQRCIFFCDESDIDYIKSFREDYETIFIPYPLSSFYSNQYADDAMVHSDHSPSLELSLIWHEKMHLMKMAKDYDIENGSSTDFYFWVDAGVAEYREKRMPSVRLNLKDVHSLPHDKVCYSGVQDNNYTKLDGTPLENVIVTGSIYIMHREIVDMVHDMYYSMLAECNAVGPVNKHACGSDQYIFTELKDKYPDIFYKLSDGYAANVKKIYDEYV